MNAEPIKAPDMHTVPFINSSPYYSPMDDFERKWKIIQDLLASEAAGTPPRRFSSGRTLFGIKSEAEKKMERFAREIEEENLARLKNEASARQEDDCGTSER